MSKTTEISIRCLHCHEWFPSPIFFANSDSFDTAKLFGNFVQCLNCNKMTSCNKSNFRARFEDGGSMGEDT